MENYKNFIHAQTYGKKVESLNGDNNKRSGRRLRYECKQYPLSKPPLGRQHTLSELLTSTLGPEWYTPHQLYQLHTSIPSARSLFPTRLSVVVLKDEVLNRGLYDYQQNRDVLFEKPVDSEVMNQLIHLCGLEYRKSLKYIFFTCSNNEVIPEEYGELSYSLATLEAGHAAEQLSDTARRHHLHPLVKFLIQGEGIKKLIGWKGDHYFLNHAIALYDEPMHASTEHIQSSITGIKSRSPTFLEIDRTADQDVAGFTTVESVKVDSRNAFFNRKKVERGKWRSSGRSLFGLSALPVHLDPFIVDALIDAAGNLKTEMDVDGIQPLISVYLTINRVSSWTNGTYEVKEDGLHCVSEGYQMSKFQKAFSYPSTQVNVHACNLIWSFVVNYDQAYLQYGARSFKILNNILGMMAQVISLSAGEKGLFSRPVKSFYEHVLDHALSLEEGKIVAYQLLMGVDKTKDVEFEL